MRGAKSLTDRELHYVKYRQRYLPGQLAAARARVAALENEARRYGMHYILTHPEAVDEAWEREVANGKREGGEA